MKIVSIHLNKNIILFTKSKEGLEEICEDDIYCLKDVITGIEFNFTPQQFNKFCENITLIKNLI